MKLLYISGARLPSEMAHGLQIMQNCEAFAANGADVQLWYARRMATANLHEYYGVRNTFHVRKLPCIDVHAFVQGRVPAALEMLAFYILLVTFGFAAGIGAWFVRPDLIYCRDPLALLVAGWLNPRRRVVWEAHSLKTSGKGTWLQRHATRRANLVVAVTPPLRDDLLKLHPVAKIIVAHDGIRAERFAAVPPQATAREALGWPQKAFIVGYVGRLTTYGMAKGVDTLVEAIAAMPDRESVSLALVGGPDDVAAQYRSLWLELNLPEENFLYTGQIPAARVPIYLSAFDVCAMPLPYTKHFAKYASPLKLFEYMASGRALVATDLPSWADVVTNGLDALLVPPSNTAALAHVLHTLHYDGELRERLGTAAQIRVFERYTWDARARAILEAAE